MLKGIRGAVAEMLTLAHTEREYVSGEAVTVFVKSKTRRAIFERRKTGKSKKNHKSPNKVHRNPHQTFLQLSHDSMYYTCQSLRAAGESC